MQLLLKFIEENSLHLKDELVFFGGSFNPWHSGHTACLQLIDQGKSVIVIPDHNPEKEIVKNEQKLTSLTQLKNHVEAAHPNAKIFDSFLHLNEKNPTAIWVQELKASLKNIKISLLMGHDSFTSLHKWIKAQELIQNLSVIYIASRLESEDQRVEQSKRLQEISKNLKIVFLGHHDFESLSSTDIRSS